MTKIREFIRNTRPVEALVTDLIPLGQRGALVAQPAGGKSWWAEDLAIAVASGRLFLNRYEIACSGPVLLVDQDTPTNLLSERMNALTGGSVGEIPLHVASHYGIALNQRDGMDQLRELAASVKPVLIVLETFDTLTAGDFNENNAKEVGALFDYLNLLIRDHGCTLLLSHHFSKMRQGDNPLSWVRGSTALPARIDFGFALEPLSTLSSDNKRFLAMPFAKRMRTPTPMQFELQTKSESGRLIEASLSWVRDWDLSMDPDMADKCLLILDLAEEQGVAGITVSEIENDSEGYLSMSQVRQYLDYLHREQRLVRGTEGHGRFRFWVPQHAPEPPQQGRLIGD